MGYQLTVSFESNEQNIFFRLVQWQSIKFRLSDDLFCRVVYHLELMNEFFK